MTVQARHPGATITPGGGAGGGPGFPVSGVVFAFTQADLVAGVFTGTHNFGQPYVTWALYNNTDFITQPDDAFAVDANNFAVDLTNFQPIAGVWHLMVVGG